MSGERVDNVDAKDSLVSLPAMMRMLEFARISPCDMLQAQVRNGSCNDRRWTKSVRARRSYIPLLVIMPEHVARKIVLVRFDSLFKPDARLVRSKVKLVLSRRC